MSLLSLLDVQSATPNHFEHEGFVFDKLDPISMFGTGSRYAVSSNGKNMGTFEMCDGTLEAAETLSAHMSERWAKIVRATKSEWDLRGEEVFSR